MNKSELIDAIATKADVTKAVAARSLDAVMASIQDALVSGDTVSLIGFGNFSVAARPARTGRNPKTGEPMEIAASKTAKFSAGKALKDSLR